MSDASIHPPRGRRFGISALLLIVLLGLLPAACGRPDIADTSEPIGIGLVEAR